MRIRARLGLVCVWGAISCLLAMPANAQLSTAEFKCQNTVAKQGRKLFRKTFKALAKCEDQISKGDLPNTTDCTSETDTAAAIGFAETGYAQRLTDSCTNSVVTSLNFGGSCSGV